MTDKEQYVPTYKCLSCGEIFNGTPIDITQVNYFGIPEYAFHICDNGDKNIGKLF